MPLRRVAGSFDWTPRGASTGRARQALPPQDDLDALLEWLDDIGLAEQPEYWAIYEDVPERRVLPPGAVKGAPGDEVVRTDTPATLRRWQGNRRMREVATAWRPDLPADEAVEAWYRQGGTMQPLRWSDAEVSNFASSLRGERGERGGEPERGQYVLFVDPGRGSRRQRRERGAPGSERRAIVNARRREQYRRKRQQ